jgi:hypothetical protein
MAVSVFDKTDKGREEIATRKHQLASRLRTLLVLIDGKQDKDALLAKVAGIGLGEDSFAELVENGFIQPIVEATAVPVSERVAAADDAVPPSAALPTGHAVLPEGQTQLGALYHFYTETIKSTIGLRGFGLQLKVEKANSVEDFRQLRQSYLDAVLKAQGEEMARSLRQRLDQLLSLGEVPVAIAGDQSAG